MLKIKTSSCFVNQFHVVNYNLFKDLKIGQLKGAIFSSSLPLQETKQ